jgi:transcriptional regulator with XRE-family HTH domain
VINDSLLRRLRLDRGLSQRKLAAAAGVDPLTITRLEGGADMSDLPLRVLGNIATALGVPTADLLTHSPKPTDQSPELATTLGSLLTAAGPQRVSTCALGRATNSDLDTVAAGLETLTAHLAPAGIAVARHGHYVWLAPRHDHCSPSTDHPTLDVNQARLLRRIHRGEDVRRKLTQVERQVTLPSLLRLGLLADDTAVSDTFTRSVGPSHEATRPARARARGRDTGRHATQPTRAPGQEQLDDAREPPKWVCKC